LESGSESVSLVASDGAGRIGDLTGGVTTYFSTAPDTYLAAPRFITGTGFTGAVLDAVQCSTIQVPQLDPSMEMRALLGVTQNRTAKPESIQVHLAAMSTVEKHAVSPRAERVALVVHVVVAAVVDNPPFRLSLVTRKI